MSSISTPARAASSSAPRRRWKRVSLYLRDINWLGDGDIFDVAADGFACFAKVRSTRQPAPAILRADAGGISVELLEGEAGVAPGQACALYSGIGEDARVYGGGFILRSEREAAAEAALKDLLQGVVAA